ncbi:MAG: hydroxymethylglutaryl-CoA lyase [Solirubrobacterales bacterium]
MTGLADGGPLPDRVMVREEGPRDGWQNIEDPQIPTEKKLQLIDGLLDAGITRISLTAMMRPDWVPQLADAEQVLRGVTRRPGVSYGVLVPNEKGWQRARGLREEGCPIDEISLVISASEAHNQSNVNMSIADSLRALEGVIGAARADGLHVCGGMAMAFGCCFEGAVPEDRVVELARALREMGCDELVFGDTTGMANPLLVRERAARLRDEFSDTTITLHFHNTRGAGLANVLAALEVGVDSFESAFGELGGCQFAHGATGNIGTEDLVSMLHEMGIETGIDLERLLVVTHEMEELLGRRLDSHVLHAGPIDWTGQAAAAGGREAPGVI